MTDKNVTYTPEQTNQAVQEYQAGTPIEAIALALGKSTRSVIAKLAREGVYEAKAKTGATRVTKAVMVAAISAVVGKELTSLEKSSYEDLEVLYKFVAMQEA
jgi:hypothetical protein